MSRRGRNRAPWGAVTPGLCGAALWLTSGLAQADESGVGASLLREPPREVSFRLDRALSKSDDPRAVDLLLPFREASFDRAGPVRSYTGGPWGGWVKQPRVGLVWGAPREGAPVDPLPGLVQAAMVEQDFASFLRSITVDELVRDSSWTLSHTSLEAALFDTTGRSTRSDGLSSLFALPPATPIPDWRCRRSPVLVTRSGGEGERFELVRCDDSIAPLALDKLSILARPEGTPRPFDELPDEPRDDDWESRREWADGVRLVHPRLLWVLQQVADAFPRRAIILYSGVRPLAVVNDGTGHKSLHASGRALDIAVHRTSNEELFKLCASLRGVGCGFYPEAPFIHVDVRHADAGTAFWVDGSKPGEPARYQQSFPGLVEAGKLSFPIARKGRR
jgi:hypothetical protein